MTEELEEYVYDEVAYEARLQELLQRSKNNRKRMKNASYDDLDRLQKEGQKITRQIEDLINELEVEDFLMRGPGGKDP